MPIVQELCDRLSLLSAFTFEDGFPPSEQVLAAFAAFAAPLDGYRAPEVDVRADSASGPHGDIPLRLYAPRAPLSGIGLVWVHGGGFAAGDLDMVESDGVARQICSRTGTVVITVDYRLARDGVHFPVPHDDVVAAWHWSVSQASDLGIDTRLLALGGGSAGGNLAAGATLRLRDEGATLPSCLLLAYPALDQRLGTAEMLPEEITSLPPLLRFPQAEYSRMIDNYLGDSPPSPYAIPSLGCLAGLPPTAVLTCEYDDLRPSAEAFVQALRKAGVVVAERCERGVVHGHLNIPGLPAAAASIRFLEAALTGGVEAAAQSS